MKCCSGPFFHLSCSFTEARPRAAFLWPTWETGTWLTREACGSRGHRTEATWENKPQKCVIDFSRITLSHHLIWMHPFMWLLHLGRPRWSREARIKDSTFLRTENTCFLRKGREWPVEQDRLLEIYLKPGLTIFLSVSLDKELNLWGSAFKMGIHQGPLNTRE